MCVLWKDLRVTRTVLVTNDIIHASFLIEPLALSGSLTKPGEAHSGFSVPVYE
jgi:hypothetical protein